MLPGTCCVNRNYPSGHKETQTLHVVTNFTPCDVSGTSSRRPCDFSGPYRDYQPPGCRKAAVGEAIWGDVPYLPSYLDKAHVPHAFVAGPEDNLHCRGAFFKGVSETHDEFINRGGIKPREFHKYKRHYELPGMKNNRSITQTDFGPPYPKTRGESQPLDLEQQHEFKAGVSGHKPSFKTAELGKQYQEPEAVIVEEFPKRDFSTEHSDNFVCYQREKEKPQFMDLEPERDEMFLIHLHNSHAACNYGPPPECLCDPSKRCENHECHCQDRADLRRNASRSTPRDFFRKGYLILPNKDTPQNEVFLL